MMLLERNRFGARASRRQVFLTRQQFDELHHVCSTPVLNSFE